MKIVQKMNSPDISAFFTTAFFDAVLVHLSDSAILFFNQKKVRTSDTL